MLSQYTWIDLLVFAMYLAILVASGWWVNRSKVSARGYFLAQQNMPVWLVAISILATSQSAATFLGGPDQGYRGDLSYLATNIGALLAASIVSLVLLPKFYTQRVTTVYQLLTQRFGSEGARYASAVYLFGRVFASGARLFMAALAVSMILFGDIATLHVFYATAIIGITAVAYCFSGGIKSVIYSDSIQCVIYVSAAIAVLYYLITQMPVSIGELYHVLESDQKLTLFHWDVDFTAGGVFNVASIFTGFVLLNIAAFGLDQDLTQRMLTCKDAAHSKRALYWSIVFVIPIMLLFIIIGLLLYVFYQRPDVMMQSALAETPEFAGQTVTVFMYYVLNELPNGLKALVTIGIIAAALSTLNSGLNSMSCVLVNDFILPKRPTLSPVRQLALSRACLIMVAIALCAMAMLCFYWQQHTDMPLLAFALSVMVFSYSGLLGVFFIALFTNRGTLFSMIMAMIVGFAIPLLCQPYVSGLDIGFTWQLCLGTLASSLICFCGKPQHVQT